MFDVPPLPPTWDGFHPLIVHFPIGLLLSAPLLVVLSLALRKHEHPLKLGALVMMLFGTIGAFLAVSSGEAAEEIAGATGEASRILSEHERAAETARTIFAVLTFAWALFTVVPWISKKPISRTLILGGGVGFLLAYSLACLVLANTAHLGGMLVHDFGLRARLSATTPNAAPPPAAGETEDSQDHN